MTISQFRKRAVAGFHKANPDAQNVEIRWVFGPKRVKYPTGLVGIRGHFYASADGYKRKLVIADWDSESRKLIVR